MSSKEDTFRGLAGSGAESQSGLLQCCCVTKSLGVSGADRDRYFHRGGCGPVDLPLGPGRSSGLLGSHACPHYTGQHKSSGGAAAVAG